MINNKIQLVTLTGKAGTGKTLLALASALEKRKSFQQIFLARPIVPLSNRDLGFLPGDIDSKLTPYMHMNILLSLDANHQNHREK